MSLPEDRDQIVEVIAPAVFARDDVVDVVDVPAALWRRESVLVPLLDVCTPFLRPSAIPPATKLRGLGRW